jgi:hypothetical protein
MCCRKKKTLINVLQNPSDCSDKDAGTRSEYELVLAEQSGQTRSFVPFVRAPLVHRWKLSVSANLLENSIEVRGLGERKTALKVHHDSSTQLSLCFGIRVHRLRHDICDRIQSRMSSGSITESIRVMNQHWHQHYVEWLCI